MDTHEEVLSLLEQIEIIKVQLSKKLIDFTKLTDYQIEIVNNLRSDIDETERNIKVLEKNKEALETNISANKKEEARYKELKEENDKLEYEMKQRELIFSNNGALAFSIFPGIEFSSVCRSAFS